MAGPDNRPSLLRNNWGPSLRLALALPISPADVHADQKWTFSVEAFARYHITYRYNRYHQRHYDATLRVVISGNRAYGTYSVCACVGLCEATTASTPLRGLRAMHTAFWPPLSVARHVHWWIQSSLLSELSHRDDDCRVMDGRHRLVSFTPLSTVVVACWTFCQHSSNILDIRFQLAGYPAIFTIRFQIWAQFTGDLRTLTIFAQ